MLELNLKKEQKKLKVIDFLQNEMGATNIRFPKLLVLVLNQFLKKEPNV